MFQKIHIKNFKSLADVSTDLAPFTVLVGENGAGKSSFLQAIELMSWAVRYASVNDALADHSIDFRDLVYLRSPESQITLRAELDIQCPTHEIDENVHVEMRFKKRRYVYIDYEILEPVANMQSKNLHKAYGIISVSRSRRAWDKTGGKGEQSIVHQNVALGHSVLRDVYRDPEGQERFPVLFRIASHFMDYVHYEIWGPEHLRQPSAVKLPRSAMNDPRIGKSGEGLPRLLRTIRHNHSDKWEDLLKELCISFPLIRAIQFKQGLEAHELGLIFVEQASPTATLKYRPSQMSDGFMRILALLAIKHQPTPLALLGYEEPENGLHPSALHECMRHLKEIAQQGTQVILTTHSPYLLNYVLEEALEPVAELRLVIRGKDGKTRIVPPNAEKIELARRQGFGVGELWGSLLNEEELA